MVNCQPVCKSPVPEDDRLNIQTRASAVAKTKILPAKENINMMLARVVRSLMLDVITQFTGRRLNNNINCGLIGDINFTGFHTSKIYLQSGCISWNLYGKVSIHIS